MREREERKIERDRERRERRERSETERRERGECVCVREEIDR